MNTKYLPGLHNKSRYGHIYPGECVVDKNSNTFRLRDQNLVKKQGVVKVQILIFYLLYLFLSSFIFKHDALQQH